MTLLAYTFICKFVRQMGLHPGHDVIQPDSLKRDIRNFAMRNFTALLCNVTNISQNFVISRNFDEISRYFVKKSMKFREILFPP
jgi:hypothetical protein